DGEPLLARLRRRGGRCRRGRGRDQRTPHRKRAIVHSTNAMGYRHGSGGGRRMPELAPPHMSRGETIKQGYTDGARKLAARSMTGLARTRVTPNALTASGVTLCGAAAVLVYFIPHDELLFAWLAAVTFVLGSILDILD